MEPFYSNEYKIGLLGGGQLGKMLIQEAVNFNANISVLDPDVNAPCKDLVGDFNVGNLKDFDTVFNFGKDKQLVTIEIEHVNVDALEALEKEGVTVYPQPRVLRIIQDKGLQKDFYAAHNIPTAPYSLINDVSEIKTFPIVQKMRTGGYDGKGVAVLQSENDIATKGLPGASVLEELVPFETELSVIAARNANGEVKCFPLVDMAFNAEANLVEFLFSPAPYSVEIEQEAQAIATDIAKKLEIVGLLAVEMFLTKDGQLLVNEIAPRPHNSGHHTIEANDTSQYEQHFRAITNMPLGNTAILSPAVMLNLLGEAGHTGEATYVGLEQTVSQPGVHVHLYGKKVTKPFRKMGHITVINKSIEEAKNIAKQIQKELKIISK